MATASAHAQIVKILEMDKEAHWLENKNLPPDEIQRLWAERSAPLSAVLGVGAPTHSIELHPRPKQSPVQQNPQATALPQLTQRESRSNFNKYNQSNTRYYPDQANTKSEPMTKKRSTQSRHGPFVNTKSAVPPLTLNTWQSNNDEPFSAIPASSSPPAFKTRRTASGRLPVQQPDYSSISVYDPADYVKQSQPTLSPICPNYVRPRQNSSHLLSPSSSLSLSPVAFSVSDGMTDPTELSSVGMNRDDSLAGSSFYNGITMLKVDSRRSESSLKSEMMTGEPPLPSNPASHFASIPHLDQPVVGSSLSVSHALGGMGERSNLMLPKFSDDLPSLVEEGIAMSRTASSESGDSIKSRISRRSQEQVALSTRPIAPKRSSESMSRQVSSSSTSGIDMIHQLSADGSKVAIQKAKYQRPTHEKVKCSRCDLKPDGYRGPHELRRHMENRHGATRKVWICVDRSPDQAFLSKCKQCREKKRYGAYYNAACHLRRIHWNPREKGKRADKSAKGRGGNGGGDFPSMDFLKSWMEEINVPVTEDISNLEDDQDDDDYYSSDQDATSSQTMYRFHQNHASLSQPYPTSSSRETISTDSTESRPQAYVASAYDTEYIQPDISALDASSYLPFPQDDELSGFPFTCDDGNAVPSPSSGPLRSSSAADRSIDGKTTRFAPMNDSLAMSLVDPADLSLTSSISNPLERLDPSFSFETDAADFA